MSWRSEGRGDACPSYQWGLNHSFSSVTQSCPTLCNQRTAARQDSLSITNSQSLFKLMSIESVMPSNHLILCHPLLFLPSIFPSIRVFSNEPGLTSGVQSIGFQLQHQSLQWIFRTYLLEDGLGGSPSSSRDSQESSLTPQSKASILWHSASLWSNSHIHTWLLEKP